MADLAFDPNATPDFSTDPTIPGNAPAPTAPAPGSLISPNSRRIVQGVDTTATPMQPAPTPGVTAPALPFNDDEMDQNNRNTTESAYLKNPMSYLRGDPIMPPTRDDPMKDPRMIEAQAIRAEIAKLPRNEQSRAFTQLKIQEDRILREIEGKNKAAQHQADQQRQEHARNAQLRVTDPGARIKAGNDIMSVLSPIYQQYSQQGAADPNSIDPNTGKPAPVSNDPNARFERDYIRTTTPIGTLKPIEMRDVVTNIVLKNPGLSVDSATQMAIMIGAPIEMRPDEVKRLTGRDEQHMKGNNGLYGRGATNYVVRGHDPYTKDYIVEMPNGQQIRVDQASFQRLDKARLQGYASGRKMLSDREAAIAASKAPGTFQNEVVRPALDWTQRNVIDPAREMVR